jgi:hypothetical protein
VGRGAPTARGVGSDGCGAQERMRVEDDEETGARLGAKLGRGLGGGAGAARAEGAGKGVGGGEGADSGVKGSRSLKRAADSRMGNRVEV